MLALVRSLCTSLLDLAAVAGSASNVDPGVLALVRSLCTSLLDLAAVAGSASNVDPGVDHL